MNGSDEFVARVSRWRTLLVLAGALAFVAAGGWFLVAAEGVARGSHRGLLHDPLLVRVVGAVAVAFFGACAVAALRQLGDAETPVVEVDARGIRWRRWSDDWIPWSAIRETRVTAIRRQRFLSLWLYRPEAYPSSRMAGRLASMNRRMGFGDIAITLTGADAGVEALAEAVAANAPHLFER